MHNFKISENIRNILSKLSKKEKFTYDRIFDKIDEIVNCYSLEHYKNLRYNMKEGKRVHIGHFVLIFHYDKSSDTVFFDDFDHHDEIYRR